MSSLLEDVFEMVQTQINEGLEAHENLQADSEIAGYAQELRALSLSDANDEIPTTAGVAMIWISDGRKDGEGAAAGTGCVSILDQGQSPAVWLRTSDYTAVVI